MAGSAGMLPLAEDAEKESLFGFYFVSALAYAKTAFT